MRQIYSAFLVALLATVLVVLSSHSVNAIYPGDPGFKGCVIASSNGALADVDCDRVPDQFDNCPFILNPDQIDVDNNGKGNGIGDACDLVIDEIRLDPETPIQGRSMLATVSIFNARPYPMRNLVVKLEVPKLGVANNEVIPLIKSGERLSREIVVRIPECAPTKLTDVVVYVEYPFAPGQQEIFSHALKVPVMPGDTCATGVVDDKTVVNILELQDVDVQTGALYPFTIHNNQQESKAYVLSISGNEDWGYSEINPGTVIVVPPGESKEGAIQAYAYPGISGMKSMVLTVQAKDDVKQIMLRANIPVAVAPSMNSPLQLILGLLGFAGIIVLMVITAMYVKKKSKHKK